MKMPWSVAEALYWVFCRFGGSEAEKVAFRALVAAAVALEPHERPNTEEGVFIYIETYSKEEENVERPGPKLVGKDKP